MGQGQGNVTGLHIAILMALMRGTKAPVLPRAEKVQIQGKEWLPGPRSITTCCQGAADLTPMGPAPMRS